MKVLLSWLKDFVDIDISADELAKKLLNGGFEVESLEYLGKNIENVVVAKILDVAKHPNADKLSVCEMDIGNGQRRTILTAATNVFSGAVVPAALDGASLPNGLKIKTCMMRGVESQGMLCSPNELLVDGSIIEGGDVDGILILPKDAEAYIGQSIINYFAWDDYVFDISITSNRPDAGSVLGLAREISVLLDKPLRLPKLEYKAKKGKSVHDGIKISVLDNKNCPNYNCAMADGIKIEPSPKWMRERLRHSGIRPINNIVDITNYVLLEIGSPMHAFDMQTLVGKQIIVRGAKKDESITALDGKSYALNEGMLLICDAEKPVGIAGVMGGEYSGITNETKTIAFESAKFLRGSIRRTSRSLGLRSDSSARFEKGVDAGTSLTGLHRALSLVDELKCGSIYEDIISVQTEIPKKRNISVSISKINGLLGITVPKNEILRILKKLDIETKLDGDTIHLELPLYRDDLEGYQDIAEEIIRIYGYEHIEPSIPVTFIESAGLNDEQKLTETVKQVLASVGAYEALTYSFINKNAFDKLRLSDDDPRRNSAKLLNPISEEFGVMRTLMAHNMLEALALNQNRKNFNVRLFEVAKVYLPLSLPLAEPPKESRRLCVGIMGKNESFFTLKGIIEEVFSLFGLGVDYKESTEPFLHNGISADIFARGRCVGYLGCVHPLTLKNYEAEQNCFIAEIDFDFLAEIGLKNRKFKPLPRFQEMERDVALTIKDDIKSADVLRTIKKMAGHLAESVELFDVYKGKQIDLGYKSLAYKIIFRSPERTLVESEVCAIMDKIIASLIKNFDAKIRGL